MSEDCKYDKRLLSTRSRNCWLRH